MKRKNNDRRRSVKRVMEIYGVQHAIEKENWDVVVVEGELAMGDGGLSIGVGRMKRIIRNMCTNLTN